MKSELDRSKASFKLDLIETANADPMVSRPDFKVLAAYVAMMAWPSCKVWLATSLAMAMTGLSDRQVEKSKASLLGKNAEGRAYLIPVRRSGKVASYMLINPWRDEARDRIDAMLGYHREVARQKKEKKRASVSPNSFRGQNTPCPRTVFGPVPEQFSDNNPLGTTPRKKGGREEIEKGSNVIPITRKPRKAS